MIPCYWIQFLPIMCCDLELIILSITNNNVYSFSNVNKDFPNVFLNASLAVPTILS